MLNLFILLQILGCKMLNPIFLYFPVFNELVKNIQDYTSFFQLFGFHEKTNYQRLHQTLGNFHLIALDKSADDEYYQHLAVSGELV